MTDALLDIGSAVFSPCGLYRYRLTREGLAGRPERSGYVTWIMLNPSTADASVNDPTIRRCIGYTRREGYGSLVVVNLYAWRSTDPTELRRVASPCGPDNDAAILTACESSSLTIAAWGADPMAPARAAAVEGLLDGLPLWCLGTTKDGAPRHPLYLKGEAPLVPYNAAAELLAGQDRTDRSGSASYEGVSVYCDLSEWLGHPDAEGPSGKHFHGRRDPRQRGMDTCGDTCPTDTTERCELPAGHDGWHEGRRLRWRRAE